MRPPLLLVLVCLSHAFLSVPDSARAAVPDPTRSTCPPAVIVGSAGCCFDVVVRDLLNIPVAGSLVRVDFGPCAVSFCAAQMPGITVGPNYAQTATNAQGIAHFCICGSISSPGCRAQIFADGVLLCSVPAQGCGLTVAQCGTLVQGVECVFFQPDGSSALYFLGNLAGFHVGDRVYVEGIVDPQCLNICLQGNGCIRVSVILPGCPRRNRPPDCSNAMADPAQIWPPDHELVPVTITGVTDPDHDRVTITVTGSTQDDPTNQRGDGNTCPDAVIANGAAQVRAERSGRGNGRVYVVSFTASDGQDSCAGSVRVCVPHDQGQDSPDPAPIQRDPGGLRGPSRMPDGDLCIDVDDGQRFNSIEPCPRRDQIANDLPTDVMLTSSSAGNTVTLQYSLPWAEEVTIGLYDIAGRRVATLFRGHQDAAPHQLSWNAGTLRSGMYFYRLQAGQKVIAKSFLKLR